MKISAIISTEPTEADRPKKKEHSMTGGMSHTAVKTEKADRAILKNR